MARKWDDVKKQFDGETDIEERRGRARADLAAEIDAFNATLADLRRAQGYTQMQLSKILGVSQGQVSKVERQADLYLSTLATYLEALGAELELAAVLEDGTRVTLAIADLAGGEEVPARVEEKAELVGRATPTA